VQYLEKSFQFALLRKGEDRVSRNTSSIEILSWTGRHSNSKTSMWLIVSNAGRLEVIRSCCLWGVLSYVFQVYYLIFHMYACFCEWSIFQPRKMHLQTNRTTLLGIFITIQSLKFFGEKKWRLTINRTGRDFPTLTTYFMCFILGKWGENLFYKFSER
jgi:hypothetical protein